MKIPWKSLIFINFWCWFCWWQKDVIFDGKIPYCIYSIYSSSQNTQTLHPRPKKQQKTAGGLSGSLPGGATRRAGGKAHATRAEGGANPWLLWTPNTSGWTHHRSRRVAIFDSFFRDFLEFFKHVFFLVQEMDMNRSRLFFSVPYFGISKIFQGCNWDPDMIQLHLISWNHGLQRLAGRFLHSNAKVSDLFCRWLESWWHRRAIWRGNSLKTWVNKSSNMIQQMIQYGTVSIIQYLWHLTHLTVLMTHTQHLADSFSSWDSLNLNG